MTTNLSERREQSPKSVFASPLDRMQSQIDRMFSELPFSMRWPEVPFSMRWPEVFSGNGSDLLPVMEMHTTDDKVTLCTELPGVEEKDIDVSVDGDTVTVSGEKKSAVERKNGDRYHSERTYGSFSRSVMLPFEVDEKKVEAVFKNGVLTLTIEKPAEMKAKAHKIPIKH